MTAIFIAFELYLFQPERATIRKCRCHFVADSVNEIDGFVVVANGEGESRGPEILPTPMSLSFFSSPPPSPFLFSPSPPSS